MINRIFSFAETNLRMFANVVNSKTLPFFMEGEVCKGFGRGSRELGIPTANFAQELTDKLPNNLKCGIYYGFASVNAGPLHKAVTSIGWNPFYQNEKKSMETHIMHDFGGEFYGSALKIAILGYIRPERDFSSVEDLIKEIRNDIKIAEEELDEKKVLEFENHPFFAINSGSGSNITSDL